MTRQSLLAETERIVNGSLFASMLGIDYAVFGCERHGDLPNNGQMQNNILTILVTDTADEDPAPGQRDGPGGE